MWRFGRCGELLVLGGSSATSTSVSRAEARTVPLAQIVGTVARCCDFDACFRPLRPHLRARLDRLRRQPIRRPIAPVVLHETPTGYYVIDGHHRIALARERGQLVIDAHVRSQRPHRAATHHEEVVAA